MMRELFERFVQKHGRLPTEFDPDYLEMLRMSKYRVLDVPDVKPGKCANCGSSKNDGRRYVDFGLEVEWYGAVFLDGLCLNDIAKTVGLFQPYIDEIGRLRAELLGMKILQQKGVDLEDKILHTFEEVKEYFDGLHSVSNNDSTNDIPNLDPVVSESESGTDTTEQVSSGAEQGTSKSNTGKRPTDLRSFAELLDT